MGISKLFSYIFSYKLKVNISELLLLCVRKPRAFCITSQQNKTRVLDVIILKVSVYRKGSVQILIVDM